MTERVTQTERAIMAHLYVTEKKTLRGVAAETGRGYATVYRALHRAGVQMRKPGERGNGGTPRPPGTPARIPVTRAERQRMVALYGTGLTLAQVAKEVCRATGTVIAALETEGVKRRRPGPPTLIRHWCGMGARHKPHLGCNGFGLDAGPASGLCTRGDRHPAHVSCDGFGAQE